MEGTITQLGLSNYLINDQSKKRSFFNHSYTNYANFAKDTRALQFLADVDFGKRVSFRFDQNGRYGDLISNIILQVELPSVAGFTVPKTGGGVAQAGYTNAIGNALIKEVTLKLGGNIIDRHTSEFMDIWSSFSLPAGKQATYARQVKQYATQSPFNNQVGGTTYIPFFFWFCQNTNANLRGNTAMALPLAGMRNAEVELIVEFRSFEELIIYEPDAAATLSTTYPGQFKIANHQLLVDYITLEGEERVRYLEAQRQLYLMTQIQTQTYDYDAGTTGLNINLREFKYPVSELLWVFRANTNKAENNYFNYTNSFVGDPASTTVLATGRLVFDSRDRTPDLPGTYFTEIEPFKVHDHINPLKQIHCYSFALEPENLAQPTGVCNFSGLHEPRFQFKLSPNTPAGELHVFAINYNVLQVDNKGNVWLLHNLSKSTPTQITPPIVNGLNTCDLTVEVERRAKDVIAQINRFNIYRDPRSIEAGLANRIMNYKQKKNVTRAEGVMPFLDALYADLESVQQQLAKGYSHIVLRKDGTRVIEIGNKEVPIEDVESLLASLEQRRSVTP